MAEALGAASSIVTLVETALKVFEYIKAVKDAPKDVKKLTSELQHLIDVLQILQTAKLTSDVRTLLESPLHQCLQELNSLRDKLPMRGGFAGVLDRLKWPLKEGEVKKHIDQFERFKGLFTLALVVDNTELVRKFEPQLSEMLSTMQSFKREQELRLEVEKLRRSDEKRDKLLKWLSAENFDGRHTETRSRRTEGTGQWIEQALELQRWISGDHDGRLLWGKGDPGAGKTFLCSVVIDHLQDVARMRDYAVAYFYFTYDNQGQQKLQNVLAALATQLLISKSHLSQDMELWYDNLEESTKKTRPTSELLETMIHHASKAFSQVFFVFDALDECNEDARADFLLFLAKMRHRGVNFFVISRPHLEDLNESLADAATLQLSANQEDLKIYIQNTISRNKRAKHLFQDPNRKEKVVSVLTECANGMFQFVYLLLDELCGYRRVSDMISALDKLEHCTGHSRTYAAIYDKTIQRLQDQPQSDKELAMITLVWLVKARRPLAIEELRIAVSVRPNMYKLSDDDFPPRNSLVDVCGGLVTIDRTSGTVRLVHSTVQEHLLCRPDLIQQDMDFLVLETCTTYLSFDLFKRGPIMSLVDFSDFWNLHRTFFRYATEYWQSLASTCREDLSTDIIHKFLRCPEAVVLYVQARYIGPWLDVPSYAKVLPRMIPSGSLPRPRDIRPIWKMWFPLHIACKIGHGPVVQRLLDEGESPDVADDMGMMPLHHAVQAQNEAVVCLLLRRHVDISAQDGGLRRTPLHLAVQTENEKTVALLLSFGADISAQDNDGWTSLHFAALSSTRSSVGIVHLLLKKDAARVVSAQDGVGRTPLHLAVHEGNEEIAKMLIDFGADVSACTKGGQTPVHFAALSSTRNSSGIVSLLLKNNAAVSVKDWRGRTPLHLAAQTGTAKLTMMVLLQDFSGSFEAQAKGGRTPLHDRAASAGSERIVGLLLERGAAISAQDNMGRTPLHLAAIKSCDEEAVKMLLQFGADVSAYDDQGITPLDIAESGRNKAIMQLFSEQLSAEIPTEY